MSKIPTDFLRSPKSHAPQPLHNSCWQHLKFVRKASGLNFLSITPGFPRIFCCYPKTFLEKKTPSTHFRKKQTRQLESDPSTSFPVLCFVFVAPGHFFCDLRFGTHGGFKITSAPNLWKLLEWNPIASMGLIYLHSTWMSMEVSN